MSKIVTLRLSEQEYHKISKNAATENRTLSNFITTVVLNTLDESSFVDPIEMSQINSDKDLLKRLRKGHRDAKKMQGRMIG